MQRSIIPIQVPESTGRILNRFKLVGLSVGIMAFLGLLLIGAGLYAQPAPAGVETQVNTSTANTQQFPAIAMDTSGNTVVVWESWATDGSRFGIYAQRFTNDGSTQGNEIQVNTQSSDNQQAADVAMSATGKFTVVWMSQDQDGDGWGVYFQRYAANGTVQGPETQVATTTIGNQKHPRIAMDKDGDFTVVWTDEAQDGSDQGIFAQRFNASGVAQGSQFQVNTTASEYQGHPDISMDADGDFVITWQSLGQDGSNHGVYFQRFNATGAAQGVETQVNSDTLDNQQSPSIGMDANGNFVIAWTSNQQDGDQRGVFAQRFDLTGTAVGTEFQVNSTTADAQDEPAVIMRSDGTFAISWSSYGQDGSYFGVILQSYDASGTAQGGEIQVNTRSTDFQQAAAGAWNKADLDLFVVWMDGLDNSNDTHDGEDYGVFLQRFTLDTVTVTAVCQDLTLYLDGSGAASLTAAELDGGSVSSEPNFTLSASQTSFSCADIGQASIQLIATASPTVQDSCTATVTVQDTITPTLTCPDNQTVSNDAGSCDAVTTYTVTTSDNCSNPTLTQIAGQVSGTAFPIGTTSNIFSLSDASGNTTSCVFTITVEDTEAPILTCPSDLTVSNDPGACDAVVIYSVSSSDNCTGSTLTQTTGLASSSIFPEGITANSFELTDAAGNSITCSFTITVEDTEAPTLVCNDITVSTNSSSCSAVVNYASPTVVDNCTPTLLEDAIAYNGHSYIYVASAPSWTSAKSSATSLGGYLACIGSQGENDLIRSLSASGNIWIGLTDKSSEGTYKWVNNEALSYTNWNPGEPNQSNSAADYIEMNSSGKWNDRKNTANRAFVVEFDELAGSLTLTSGQGSGTSFSPGVHTETWSATDLNGNTSTCSFTITVEDQVTPSISCPSNITVTPPPGVCVMMVGYNDPTASDNCTPTFMKNATNFNGHAYVPSSAKKYWTTAKSNAEAMGGYLSVITSQAENDYVRTLATGNMWIGLTDKAKEGTYKWVNGESLSYTNWQPGEPNQSNWAADYIEMYSSGKWNDRKYTANRHYAVEFDYTMGGFALASGLPSGSLFPVGVTTVTWEATDEAGNVGSCSFTVTVNDNNCGSTAPQPSSQPGWEETEADPLTVSPLNEVGLDEAIELTAFPNPFDISTAIQYRLVESADVQIEIYTLQGILLTTLFQGQVEGGVEQTVEYHPTHLSKGVYVYRLTTSTGKIRSGQLIHQ